MRQSVINGVLTLIMFLGVASPTLGQPPGKAEFERFMFFATLEGLYQLSLPDETVDELLKIDPATGRPLYFVYACPICHPVYNAFKLYRSRPVFLGDKARRRDFSPYPRKSNPMVEALASSDRKQRALALQALVEELVSRKLSSMRLTSAERAQWEKLVKAASDEGGQKLAEYPDQKSWMEKCPSCTGTEGSCKAEL